MYGRCDRAAALLWSLAGALPPPTSTALPPCCARMVNSPTVPRPPPQAAAAREPALAAADHAAIHRIPHDSGQLPGHPFWRVHLAAWPAPGGRAVGGGRLPQHPVSHPLERLSGEVLHLIAPQYQLPTRVLPKASSACTAAKVAAAAGSSLFHLTGKHNQLAAPFKSPCGPAPPRLTHSAGITSLSTGRSRSSSCTAATTSSRCA